MPICLTVVGAWETSSCTGLFLCREGWACVAESGKCCYLNTVYYQIISVTGRHWHHQSEHFPADPYCFRKPANFEMLIHLTGGVGGKDQKIANALASVLDTDLNANGVRLLSMEYKTHHFNFDRLFMLNIDRTYGAKSNISLSVPNIDSFRYIIL